MKRVVVTGVGGWTCLGKTFSESWERLQNTRDCPAKPIADFDASHFPTTFACEAAVDDGERKPDITTMAIAAAKEAMAVAKMKEQDFATTRAQWFLGLGMGSPDLQWFNDVVLNESFDPSQYHEQTNQLPAKMGHKIAQAIAPVMPVQVVHTACASSALAIGEAFLAIRSGELDVCLAGGADAMVQPFQLAALSMLGALSMRNQGPQNASRPFTSERDGLVIGDGSCVLVLETLESAQARGATILAEIVGYGCTESGYRITDLHPEGKGVREAMKMALDMAQVEPKDIDYINAHGTSTLPNDRIESAAIGDLFPKTTRVSSTKSMVGHLIAAAGAIEAGFCVQALAQHTMPQSLFRDDQDPDCEITLTESKPVQSDMAYAMSNSIGFGGSNAAIIMKRGGADA